MAKDDLHQQFVSLKDVFSHVGTQLAEVCKHLAESGTPPPADLIETLETARSAFEALRGKVLTAAEFLELQPLPERDDITSLQALESLLHTVMHAGEAMEAAEEIRQRALTVLERALTLAHCERDPYEPLLDVQNRARDLHAAIAACQWTDLHPETQVLADGQHPFTALLTLVEVRQALDDEQWMSLQDHIAQAFGKPIAVPAARGKLLLPASSSVMDRDQTVAEDDDGRPTTRSADDAQASATPSQDVAALPSPGAEEGETVQASAAAEVPSMLDDEAQYDGQNIAPADLDRFLREQIRSVRKETQEHTLIRSIRQRLR